MHPCLQLAELAHLAAVSNEVHNLTPSAKRRQLAATKDAARTAMQAAVQGVQALRHAGTYVS